MLQKSPCNVFFLLFSIVLLSACSRHDLYQKVIGFERSTAGLEAASITLGELNIAYLRNIERNSGDTLVMVHGFGANKDNWTRMARVLTDTFNVYAIDLPGHGESSKPLDLGYRLDQQTAHLARILQALGIAETHMMGNSMGGAITALYAAAYPEQIKTAVLFNPAGVLEYESELFDLVVAGDNPLIPSKPGDFERLMDFALEKKPFIPWPVLGVMEHQALANQAINEVIFAAIRDADLEPDFRTVIARIKAPVLLVWGREDRVINYRNGEVFVDIIPGAQLEVLDGVGHVPMIEAPEKSARLFLEFAKSHAAKVE
jgi:pimeloyl-ACP methyl ester carboxylesterase